jgi:hypothetical protein
MTDAANEWRAKGAIAYMPAHRKQYGCSKGMRWNVRANACLAPCRRPQLRMRKSPFDCYSPAWGSKPRKRKAYKPIM